MSAREEAARPPKTSASQRTPRSSPSAKRRLISSALSSPTGTPTFEQAETSPQVPASVQSSPPAPSGNGDYYDLVKQASDYLAQINSVVNDSRLVAANKTHIMDLTQRVTSIVSLLALKSAALESKIAGAERDLALNIKCSTAPAKSYAESVKLRLPRAAPAIPTRAPLPCVVAYPTTEKSTEITTSSATKKALMQAIKPSDGFQIVGVKKTAKSGVVLRVTNEAQIKKLEKVTAIQSAGLRLEKPKGRRPRILIKDIPGTLSDEAFLSALYQQNIKDELPLSEEEFVKSIKIIRHRKLDTGRKWIGIEIDADTRKHLINTKEKLFIGWATCRYIDDLEIVRCLHCQQYGHVAKYCAEKDPRCARCAEHHKTDDCPKKACDEFKPICASCKRIKKPCDHSTGSPNCPTYKAKLEALILNTNYG